MNFLRAKESFLVVLFCLLLFGSTNAQKSEIEQQREYQRQARERAEQRKAQDAERYNRYEAEKFKAMQNRRTQPQRSVQTPQRSEIEQQREYQRQARERAEQKKAQDAERYNRHETEKFKAMQSQAQRRQQEYQRSQQEYQKRQQQAWQRQNSRNLTGGQSRRYTKFTTSTTEGHGYVIAMPLGKRKLSSEQVADFIKRDLGNTFPFNVKGTKGQAVTVGNEFSLSLKNSYLGFIENEVEVIAETPTSFTLKTKENHRLRGTVKHEIIRDKNGELWLKQTGRGERDEPRQNQIVNNGIADFAWYIFGNILNQKLNDFENRVKVRQ